MIFETVKWTIENFGCWNRKVHDNAITSPKFSINEKSFLINLYPKGLSGRGELIVLQIRSKPPFDFLADLSFIGPNGSLFCTKKINVRKSETDVEIYISLKFEDVVTSIRKKEDLHKDQLTLQIKCTKYDGAKVLRYMRSVIYAHDTSVKISGEMFYKHYTTPNKSIASISTFGWPSADINITSIDIESLVDTSDPAKIELILIPTGIKKRTFIYIRVSVLNKNDVIIRSEEKEHMFYTDEQWTFFDSLTRDRSRKEEFSLLLRIKVIPGNKYNEDQFKCDTQFKVYVDVTPTTSLRHSNSGTSSLSLEHSVDVLSKDLSTLYQDQKFSDLQINCDDVTFPVHRNILSARSPVFKTMLSSDMREAAAGKVGIKDMDSNTLGLFLSYMYTGAVDGLQYDSALKLYYAADKYQVLSLKRDCASALCDNLSVSNVCDVLSLADKHQDVELIRGSQDFLLNHFNEVLKSDEWKSFMCSQPLLASKTVTHFAEEDTVGKLSII